MTIKGLSPRARWFGRSENKMARRYRRAFRDKPHPPTRVRQCGVPFRQSRGALLLESARRSDCGDCSVQSSRVSLVIAALDLFRFQRESCFKTPRDSFHSRSQIFRDVEQTAHRPAARSALRRPDQARRPSPDDSPSTFQLPRPRILRALRCGVPAVACSGP